MLVVMLIKSSHRNKLASELFIYVCRPDINSFLWFSISIKKIGFHVIFITRTCYQINLEFMSPQ